MKEPEPLKYIPFADREEAGAWRVEALDKLTDGCYITIFVGLDAEFRANEYAAFKNGKHPVLKPAPELVATVAVPTVAVKAEDVSNKKITIKVQNGQEVTFVPSTLMWSWNQIKKTITGKQKPLIELTLGLPKGK